jgi:hypothetical protein
MLLAAAVWYCRGEQWSYLRGGLTTLDRDYGIFNKIHHNIETHVVHHLVRHSSCSIFYSYHITFYMSSVDARCASSTRSITTLRHTWCTTW